MWGARLEALRKRNPPIVLHPQALALGQELEQEQLHRQLAVEGLAGGGRGTGITYLEMKGFYLGKCD